MPTNGLAPKCRNCNRRTHNPNGLCGICLPGGTVTPAQFASLAAQANAAAVDSDEPAPTPGTHRPSRRTEFTIPDENLADLEVRIDRLARRAERIGVPPPTIEILETRDEDEVIDGTPTGITKRVHRVRVLGRSPSYDGWALRAVVDFDREADPGEPHVVHCLDDDANPDWRHLDNLCEHCNTRRDRNKVVVVRHDSGDERIVGSTCLKDFLGSTAPQSIAAWAEMLSSVDDLAASFEHRAPGSGEVRYRPDAYLAWVAKDIDEHGWHPRSQGPGATADGALDRLRNFARRAVDRYGVPQEPEPPTAAHEQAAEAALDWAMGIDPEVPNDYLANLRAVAGKSGWRHRDLGIAASIISAHQREQDRESDGARRRTRAIEAGHLGVVGDRSTFVGTVTKRRAFEGDYGTKFLIEFESPGGHIVTWWCSGRNVPTKDSTYSVTATVKEHGEFNGLPQTVVQRARFEEIEPEPADRG